MKKLLSMGICLILVIMLSGCALSGSLYQDGKKSFLDGNYEDAAADFEQAIKANPNRADYYIDYGLTLTKLGRYEEALAEFDKAYVNKDIIIANRNNKRMYRGKGITYYYMLDYIKAIEEFGNALKIRELPDLDQDILHYAGSALMIIGDYEEAVKTYTRLVDLDGKDDIAYDSRAFCYRILGEYEKSLADYDMAIKLKPNGYNHYFGKYSLLMEQGDTAVAAEVLTKASEIEIKTSEDQYNTAKLHYFQGDYETALAEFNDGFANGFQEAYYYIGEIYRIKKDYPKAIYYYETYMGAGKPATSEVYNQIGTCLIKTGQYEEALNYLEQGIAYHQAGVIQTLKRNEIIAYERLGKFDVADEKLADYISQYPKDETVIKESKFIESRLMTEELPED